MAISVEPGDRPTDDLSSSVGRVIADMHSRSYFQYVPQRAWQPSINIYETREDYYICVELAGVKAGDIDVRTEEGLLIISGHRADPRPRSGEESFCVHLMEVDSGDFRREIRVPPNVALEEIEASYREGFLWVRVPKTSPSS